MQKQPDNNARTQLRQTMGLRDAVALGIGGTIGGAIFILVGTAIDQAGPGSLFSFGLAFLAAIMIALPYAELACRYPLAGGGYAFVQSVLGRSWSFVMGWVYAGAWLFISGYVTIGFGTYLHVLCGIPPLLGALALIVAVVIINLMGNRFLSQIQKVVVVLAVTALLVYSAVGILHMNMAHFSPFLPNGLTGILAAAPLGFLALAGFDMVAAAGEEIKQPKRTLPLAILLTLGAVLVLYLLVTVVTAGVLPRSALGSSFAPLADAASVFLGPIGRQVIAVAAALTTAATGNAVLVATSRVTFAMARDGLLPSPFARVHPSSKVPQRAVIVNGIILAVIALAGSVRVLSAIGSVLYVLQFVFPLIALVVVRRREKVVAAFQTPAPYLVLPLAFGACLLLLLSSGQVGIIGGLGWLLSGLLISGCLQRLRSSLRVWRSRGSNGYQSLLQEIAALNEQLDQVLKDPHTTLEQLHMAKVYVEELKQYSIAQVRVEERELLRAAKARVEELKQYSSARLHAEELERRRALQARIEEERRHRATQAQMEELQFLRTARMQLTLVEDVPTTKGQ